MNAAKYAPTIDTLRDALRYAKARFDEHHDNPNEDFAGHCADEFYKAQATYRAALNRQ